MFSLLLIALSLVSPTILQASTRFSLPGDLSYSTETTWVLPSLPHLSATAGHIPHNFAQGEAIFELPEETIHGFRPGKEYKEMYVRDIAWGMEAAQFYYPDEYLREPIEAFLRRQYTSETRSLDDDFGVLAGEGAIGGIITPEGKSNKQTITSDEESSLIHAAYLYYSIAHDVGWLQKSINGVRVVDRLNLAADWLYSHRLDPELGLIWRGHTTDWGDVKFEESTNYTDFDPEQDHVTVSVYDQALAYLAWKELAEMNAAVGNTARAEEWGEKARALKERANARLWQPGRGFYLTHLHITPLEHNFDESAMVSISNALAVYAGLTDLPPKGLDSEQSKAILENLERVRLEAKVDKPGLSIYPYYPNQWPDLFFDYLGMGYGNYQNGGVWDWWGGVQIKTEFAHGFAERATAHLLQVAHDWAKHPGNIIEWQSSTDPEHHEGSHYYSAAAGTMGSAIIEGFFGIELDADGLTLQPRLGLNDGFIRVYQAATDRYAAYRYDWDQELIQIDYGTNAIAPVTIEVLVRPESIYEVRLDGQPVQFNLENVANDTYLVFSAPTGQHYIEITKGPLSNEPAAKETSTDAAADSAQDLALLTSEPIATSSTRMDPADPAARRSVSEQLPATNSGGGNYAGESIPGPTIETLSDFSHMFEAALIGIPRESQLELLNYLSTSLVVFSSLGLIVLILGRSRRR
jgi:hypothetical protein